MKMVAAGSDEKKIFVDEVSGWLRLFDDGTVDRRWTGPPEALFLMEPVPPSDTPLDGVTLHDVPALNPSFRVYLPQQLAADNDNSKLPVLLHFHGGGFCITHATWYMYHHFYSRLASAIPAIVVSPFLPLAPEHRLPAAIDTCYSALLWLRSLSRGLHRATADDAATAKLASSADFSRVFLIGDSSGGNLVHHVAARAGAAERAEEGFWAPLRLAGGIPIHPGFVRATRSRSELEMKPDPFLTLDMLDKFLALGLPEGATKDHPFTCPMGNASPPLEKVALPPFLVPVADLDLIRDTNLEYCEAMKRAGKEIEVVINRGATHSFYLNKMAVDSDPVVHQRTQELILAIGEFVHKH